MKQKGKYKTNMAEEIKKRMSIFQILNLLLFLVINIVLNPIYESNDDQAMAYVAMGVWGERDFHLVFINIILGKLLVLLFSIFPGLNWYVVLYELLMFVAITMLINIFEKKCQKKLWAFPIILIIYLFASSYYYYVQFSKAAGILPAVGFLYSIYLIERKECKWYKYILPGTLIILGTFYRFDVIYFIGFIFIPILAYVFLCAEKKQKIFFFSYGILVLVLAFGLRITDRMIYQSDKDWAYYMDYNTKRAILTDYGWPNYQANIERFNELGISVVDYDNFQTWDFADRDLFDTEVLEELIKINESTRSVDIWGNYCKIFIPGFLRYSFTGFMFLAIAYLFTHGEGKRKYIGVATIMAFLIAEFILVVRGRFVIYRIDISAGLAVAAICCYLAVNNQSSKYEKNSNVIYIFVTCMVMLIAGKDVIADIKDHHERLEKNYEINQLLRTEDGIYLTGTTTGGIYRTNIWKGIDEGEYGKIFRMGGWLTESPVFLKQMEKEGIQNLYEALVSREDVYCVDNDSYRYKLAYLNENYNPDTQMFLAKNINGNLIWKYVTEDLQIELADYKDGTALLTHEVAVSYTEEGLLVEGVIYEPNTNSFEQKVYVVLCDEEAGTQNAYYATLGVNATSTDKMNGRYAAFSARMNGTFTGEEKMYVLVDNENGSYFVECME